jgi:hypothetical protein
VELVTYPAFAAPTVLVATPFQLLFCETTQILDLSPVRHAVLTIRNLTPERRHLRFVMSVITITRILRKRSVERRYFLLRSFRGITRSYFLREKGIEFAIELLLFLGIAGVSIWPIIVVAGALRELF